MMIKIQANEKLFNEWKQKCAILSDVGPGIVQWDRELSEREIEDHFQNVSKLIDELEKLNVKMYLHIRK